MREARGEGPHPESYGKLSAELEKEPKCSDCYLSYIFILPHTHLYSFFLAI